MTDPTRLASDLRSLSIQAHQTLRLPDPDPATIHDLTRRAADLRRGLGFYISSPLTEWAANLEQILRERQPTTPTDSDHRVGGGVGCSATRKQSYAGA